MKSLPPLSALRAFEAVARLKSFTLAAEELHVTRAAVSHQIKSLEDLLGFKLIERHHRSISLTPPGSVALPKLRAGFNNLAEAVHLMEGQTSTEEFNKVRVWTAPSFASKWLVPRLQSFSKQFPNLNMDINGSEGLVEATRNQVSSMEDLFREKNVDVIIRFGSGKHPNSNVKKLFSTSAVPLCSPSLLNNPDLPLNKPEDLAHHTLLHDQTEYVGRASWANWFELAGIEGINVNRGLNFNHISLGISAAIDGQGVYLGMKPLAKMDIEKGHLCIPFNLSLPLELAYYIITPKKSGPNQKSVNDFIEWITKEAESEQIT